MRGLPPMPSDVIRLRLTIDVNGSNVSIAHHFLATGCIGWSDNEFSEFISGWATFAETFLLNMMPVSASFTTCRLSRFGAQPFTHVTQLPTNAGAHGEAQSLNSALCITWRTGLRGSIARSHTRLPIAADAVADDKRGLHPDFWALYQLNAADYISSVNAITVSGFATPEFVVVSRSQGGEPLPASAFAPVLSGTPDLTVATLASRV